MKSGTIRQIFIDHANEYIEVNRSSLTEQHLKVIDAIRDCYTPQAGWMHFACVDCGKALSVERCCGNRSCPTCQSGKAAKWLATRLSEQLPTHYFMITFTLPAELRPLALCEPEAVYNAMFAAASQALKKGATNPKFMGVDQPGFFGVLQTWGRTMQYHPHIHFVVPGGGIDNETGTWKSSRDSCFVPTQILGALYRGIFRDQMRRAGLLPNIDPDLWRKRFVVDSQAVGGSSQSVITYLSAYVFRSAVTDSRIVSVAHSSPVIRYRKSGSRRERTMKLEAMEFIRRYLLHVLPHAFMRIRYYGFMGSASKHTHDELVSMIHKASPEPATATVRRTPASPKPFLCECCGGKMQLYALTSPRDKILYLAKDRSTAKLE